MLETRSFKEFNNQQRLNRPLISQWLQFLSFECRLSYLPWNYDRKNLAGNRTSPATFTWEKRKTNRTKQKKNTEKQRSLILKTKKIKHHNIYDFKLTLGDKDQLDDTKKRNKSTSFSIIPSSYTVTYISFKGFFTF